MLVTSAFVNRCIPAGGGAHPIFKGWTVAKEITIMFGGAAGQGIQSVGKVTAQALSRLGLHVFAIQDYESRIRGGNTFFQLRAAPRPLNSHLETVDIMVALTEETIELQEKHLAPHGLIIYNTDVIKKEHQGDRFLPIAMTATAREQGGSSAMTNTVALGAIWAMMDLDPAVVGGVLDTIFGAKSREIVERNVKVFQAGYEVGKKYRREEYRLTSANGKQRLLVSGTEAVALGALAADCRFYSGYPMTPATGVMEFLSTRQHDYGLVVEQAEDEISALNMVIGAAFMGLRAMTGTSGGGFCLMSEAFGLAGVTETPVVVLEAMRPGPATGMPTRTGQGDLLFVTFASQDEFPRVILAPYDSASAFRLTAEAFNLAERLQLPVVVLADHHVTSSYWTLDDLPLDQVRIERGKLASPEELQSGPEFRRYRLTEDGVSPRSWPGLGSALVGATGDEHDESGHITEEEHLRNAMMDKRMRKLDLVAGDPGVLSDRQEGADTVLVGWGSTYGTLRDAVDQLRQEGRKISLAHIVRVWPFPGDQVRQALEGHRRIVVAENNSLGQMARLIRMETGIAATDRLLKYDGRQFSLDQVLAFFKQ